MKDILKNLEFKAIGEFIEKSASGGKRIIRGYASVSDILDRQNEVITHEALVRAKDDLLENSTIFHEHKHSDLPVGKTIDAVVDSNGLLITVEFTKAKFADDLWKLIEEGIINRFSIGGVVREAREKRDKAGNLYNEITRIELFETSIVGLPANPAARFELVSKSFNRAITEEIRKKEGRIDMAKDEKIKNEDTPEVEVEKSEEVSETETSSETTADVELEKVEESEEVEKEAEETEEVEETDESETDETVELEKSEEMEEKEEDAEDTAEVEETEEEIIETEKAEDTEEKPEETSLEKSDESEEDTDKLEDNLLDQENGIDLEKAKWTTAYINSLPNSSFAVIEPAYLKGKTEDKRARHLPYKDKEGNIDLPHYRNALARVNQIKPITDSITAEKLRAKAKKELEKHKDILTSSKSEDEKSIDEKILEALNKLIEMVSEKKETTVTEKSDKEEVEEEVEEEIEEVEDTPEVETETEPEAAAEEEVEEVEKSDDSEEAIETEVETEVEIEAEAEVEVDEEVEELAVAKSEDTVVEKIVDTDVEKTKLVDVTEKEEVEEPTRKSEMVIIADTPYADSDEAKVNTKVSLEEIKKQKEVNWTKYIFGPRN